MEKNKLHSLSAGRVQSVALRMVVEREQERIKFIPAGWWDLQNEVVLQGDFVNGQGIEAYPNHQVISAKLRHWDGRKRLLREVLLTTEENSPKRSSCIGSQNIGIFEFISTLLRTSEEGYLCSCREQRKTSFSEKPQPPFITSSLQQEAIKELRWTAKRTMSVAQKLYEKWLDYLYENRFNNSFRAGYQSNSFFYLL